MNCGIHLRMAAALSNDWGPLLSDGSGRPDSVSCSHLEQLVDELNLLPNIRTMSSSGDHTGSRRTLRLLIDVLVTCIR